MQLVIDYPVKYAYLGYGDANFVLAPLLLENKEYVENIKIAQDRDRVLMFDNGAWEFGQTMDVHKYYDLIKEYQPNYAVIPDIMKDCESTIKSAEKFLVKWGSATCCPKTQLIFAPQGNNLNEMLDCYTAITNEWAPFIDILGVPKHVGKWMNRITFCNEMYDQCIVKFHAVHFLGLWAMEDLTPNRIGDWYISSLDTKAPAKLATKQKFVSQMDYYNYKGNIDTIIIPRISAQIKNVVDEVNDT